GTGVSIPGLRIEIPCSECGGLNLRVCVELPFFRAYSGSERKPGKAFGCEERHPPSPPNIFLFHRSLAKNYGGSPIGGSFATRPLNRNSQFACLLTYQAANLPDAPEPVLSVE